MALSNLDFEHLCTLGSCLHSWDQGHVLAQALLPGWNYRQGHCTNTLTKHLHLPICYCQKPIGLGVRTDKLTLVMQDPPQVSYDMYGEARPLSASIFLDHPNERNNTSCGFSRDAAELQLAA
jgi:hypothetical protein